MTAPIITEGEAAPAASPYHPTYQRPCSACALNLLQVLTIRRNGGDKVFERKLTAVMDDCERCADRSFPSEAWTEAFDHLDL
jgi:hypothetical protein